MRIALCLSGQAREFQQTFSYIKSNILDIHQPDVYIHTWNTIDKSSLKVDIKDEQIDKYIDLYKPSKFLIEDYSAEKKEQIYQETGIENFHKDIKNSPKLLGPQLKRGCTKCDICGYKYCHGPQNLFCYACGGPNIHNFIAKLYSINQANKLITDQYDVVIHTRPDLCIFDKLRLTNQLSIAINYAISKDKWSYNNDKYRSLPDMLFWGTPQDVSKIIDIYHHMGEMCYLALKDSYSVYGHSCLALWVSKMKINIVTPLPRVNHENFRMAHERGMIESGGKYHRSTNYKIGAAP